MRALSIRQPWASLIASGRKTVELRTWTTSYRGPLLVVSGGRPWRGEHDYELGPMGVAICTVELVDVAPYSETRHLRASRVPAAFPRDPRKDLYAWVLRAPSVVLAVPVKGRLGLYEPDARLLRAVGIR